MSRDLVGSGNQEKLRDQAISALAAIGITEINGDGRSDPPLIKAIKDENQLLFKMLIRAGCDVNIVEINLEKCPALNLALIHGRGDFAKSLLQAGASTEVKDLFGTTPLMSAVFLKMNNATQDLLRMGANTTAQSSSGETALIVAVKKDNLSGAKIILEKSCDSIDLSTNTQSTALMFAASKGNEKMVKLLLQFGCNVDLQDVIRKTASEIAKELCYLNIVDLIAAHKHRLNLPVAIEKSAAEKLGDVMVSLQVSADNNSRITNSALQERRVQEMLRLIAESGSNINITTAAGWQPLHFAARFGNVVEVAALTTKGADVNAIANGSEGTVSVLNCAVKGGNVGVVNCVLNQTNLELKTISDGLKAAIKFNKFVSIILKNSKIITEFAQLSAGEKADFCTELRQANSKKIPEIKEKINAFEAAGRMAQKKPSPKKTMPQQVKTVLENLPMVDVESVENQDAISFSAVTIIEENPSGSESESYDLWKSNALDENLKWLRESESNPNPPHPSQEIANQQNPTPAVSSNCLTSFKLSGLELGLNPQATPFVPSSTVKVSSAVTKAGEKTKLINIT